MKRLSVIIMSVSILNLEIFATDYWKWLGREIENIYNRVEQIEKQLLKTEKDILDEKVEWLNLAIQILNIDKKFITEQINKLNEITRTTTETTTTKDIWRKWEEIGEKMNKIDEKRNQLENLLIRIQNLTEALEEKIQNKKFLNKKALPPLYAGGGVGIQKKEKLGTKTLSYFPEIEIGTRIPLKNWRETSFFMGYQKKDLLYFGIGIAFPVLSPDETREERGGWIKPEVIFSKENINPAISMNFLLKTYEFSFRSVFSSKDEENFTFHIQLRRNF